MVTRLPLVAALVAASLFVVAVPRARADGAGTATSGEVRIRGNYWRDRNTRVIAPEITIVKPFPGGTTVDAGYLLDAITSASASAGVVTDQPFTELRNEVSFGVSQRLGPATIGGRYRYSSESDYWAHTGGLTVGLDLLQKNLTLGASYFYGHSQAAQRAGASSYLWAALSRKLDDDPTTGQLGSTLTSHFGILSASQVLSRWALVEGSYEITLLDGYQANPYRTVKVGGSPVKEVVPNERVRHGLTVGLRLNAVYRAGPLHDLGIYVKYRFYTDSWGIVAHTPEARLYASLGPVGLRFTTRYHGQSQAGFYKSATTMTTLDGQPVIVDAPGYDVGVPFNHCDNAQSTPARTCYTGDAKLGAMQSVFVEGRVDLSLGFLAGSRSAFVARFIGQSRVGVSLGYYLNQIAANYTLSSPGTSVLPAAFAQYGNAYVGGVELAMPL